MPSIKQLKRQYRHLIPFPRRTTWRRWFPDKHTQNLAYLLEQQGIDVILDIGANIGQFGEKIIGAGFEGQLVSFEPLPETHKELQRRATQFSQWHVPDPIALGPSRSMLTMHLYDSSALASSHLIDQSELSDQSHLRCIGTTQVEQVPLDEVYFDYVGKDVRSLIKIDVQGAEMEVFKGARKSLEQAQGIHIEVSFSKLYEGESYYLDVLSYLRELGFAVYALSPISSKFRFGPVLQMDALLFRDPALLSHFKPADMSESKAG